MTLKLFKFPDYVGTPERKHGDDAGMDLVAATDTHIAPGKLAKIPTGIGVAIPQGYVGLLVPRSSLNAEGIVELTGIIDTGYEGEISGVLVNLSGKEFALSRGDRFAQLVIVPQLPVELGEDGNSRGVGGFGSTGK